MSKYKTEIEMKSTFDGEADALNLFLDLFACKYLHTKSQDFLVNKQSMAYNDVTDLNKAVPAELRRGVSHV